MFSCSENKVDFETSLEVDEQDCAQLVVITESCDNVFLGEFQKVHTTDNYVINENCRWDDSLVWKDEGIHYDCCLIDIFVTCIPGTAGDACWYETADGIPYATENGFLYGACAE
jgi:hypothetical protein